MAGLKQDRALVLSQGVALPESAGMSPPAFRTFVTIHKLSQSEVGLLVEMVEAHQLSVPYVGKLLGNGAKLPHIHAAYLLRNELGPLYNPDASTGRATSEFALPIEKACQFLERIYREGECDEEESVEAAVRLLCEVADRCPQVKTWSTVLEILDEALRPLSREIEERVGDLLDLPPYDKIEIMIALIDELELIDTGRSS